jgi:N4-(beta-N-acetylglucosaminyl)-L-asparaginase
MSEKISRRKFGLKSLGFGSGLLLYRSLDIYSEGGKSGRIPLIITDHTNKTGRQAVTAGLKILENGGSALDAVEKSTNIVELDPEDMTVGYGGLPNEDCVVQLDASVMDGKTYNAGSVACLENIKTPCSVARIVMEKTDHVMLVGKGALQFARKWGFKEENLLTDKARKVWLRWKEHLNKNDDWGPPDHLRNFKKIALKENIPFSYGTTNHLAVDQNGDIAGITSTSGLAWKISGRVGDSPIIGAGLYVDNDIGAAGATGRGEDVIKSCASYFIVMRMGQGRTPQQACEDAMKMIVAKYRKVNPDFFPSEKFIALNKKGEYGCAFLIHDRPAKMTVASSEGVRMYTGSYVFPKKKAKD